MGGYVSFLSVWFHVFNERRKCLCGNFFWLTTPPTVVGHEYAVDAFCVCERARVKDGQRKKEADTDRRTGTQTDKSSIVRLT